MNYIKSLHIEGFKKFVILDVQFNEHMNILVGENEAGKSTILAALKMCIRDSASGGDRDPGYYAKKRSQRDRSECGRPSHFKSKRRTSCKAY